MRKWDEVQQEWTGQYDVKLSTLVANHDKPVEGYTSDGDDDGHWTTQDGRRIPYESMEESHLGNTLRMLVRRAMAQRLRRLADYLAGPLPKTDEGYKGYVADWKKCVGETFLDHVHPKYGHLADEARGRGISWKPFQELAQMRDGADLANIPKLMSEHATPTWNKDNVVHSLTEAASNLNAVLYGSLWFWAAMVVDGRVVVYTDDDGSAMWLAMKAVPRIYQGFVVDLRVRPTVSMPKYAPPAPEPTPAPTPAAREGTIQSWYVEAVTESPGQKCTTCDGRRYWDREQAVHYGKTFTAATSVNIMGSSLAANQPRGYRSPYRLKIGDTCLGMHVFHTYEQAARQREIQRKTLGLDTLGVWGVDEVPNVPWPS